MAKEKQEKDKGKDRVDIPYVVAKVVGKAAGFKRPMDVGWFFVGHYRMQAGLRWMCGRCKASIPKVTLRPPGNDRPADTDCLVSMEMPLREVGHGSKGEVMTIFAGQCDKCGAIHWALPQ